MSLPEVLLWRELKSAAGGRPKFRRQHPFGPFVLDFYCAQARLCLEVDGLAHGTGDRPGRDLRRDRYLERAGVRVHRIAATAVLADPRAAGLWARDLAAALSAERALDPPRGSL